MMENKENEFSSIKIGLASPEQIREWLTARSPSRRPSITER